MSPSTDKKGYSLVHADAKCRKVTLKSSWLFWNRYKETTVSQAAKVTRMEVENTFSTNECIQGKSYGFYGPQVWVNHGCSASFKICYIRGDSIHVTCKSSRSHSKSCKVPGRIKYVAVKSNTFFSRVACVKGKNYIFSGRVLTVSNGCSANFVVGYTK